MLEYSDAFDTLLLSSLQYESWRLIVITLPICKISYSVHSVSSSWNLFDRGKKSAFVEQLRTNNRHWLCRLALEGSGLSHKSACQRTWKRLISWILLGDCNEQSWFIFLLLFPKFYWLNRFQYEVTKYERVGIFYRDLSQMIPYVVYPLGIKESVHYQNCEISHKSLLTFKIRRPTYKSMIPNVHCSMF